MKFILNRYFKYKKRNILLFLILPAIINTLTTIPLKISSAEYKREYLQSLKFIQRMIHNPILSSFFQNQEISLHQQVIAQKRLATYYGELVVGTSNPSQTFRMLFDTGSCEFWIPSIECTSERCLSHNRYKDTPSKKPYNSATMDIQYLSGHVSGDMVLDTIYLGDLKVENQVIGLANQIDIPLMNEVIWDGIIGLAYPNKNLKNKGISPIIDNIINQNILHNIGQKNQFAYYLGFNNGAITFGGADMKYKKDLNEEFKWAPIAERNYWTITLLDIRKYPKESISSENEIVGDVICPFGCKSIVDTGTYLIYGPSSQIKRFLKDMKLDTCADKKNLPNLGLVFKGFSKNGKDSAFELILTPDDYVLEFEVDGYNDCVIGFGSDGDDSDWTLGQVFLKAYYTVFDRETEAIGFVKSNPIPGMIIEKSEVPDHLEKDNQTNIISSSNNSSNNETKIDSESKNEISLNGDLQNGPINLNEIKKFDYSLRASSNLRNNVNNFLKNEQFKEKDNSGIRYIRPIIIPNDEKDYKNFTSFLKN